MEMPTELISGKTAISATVNGESAEFLCEPRETLLEVLRDRLGLTGSKEGCNNGNCGACNIIMDGRLVNSCCVLGVEAEGSEISTIEGMGCLRSGRSAAADGVWQDAAMPACACDYQTHRYQPRGGA